MSNLPASQLTDTHSENERHETETSEFELNNGIELNLSGVRLNLISTLPTEGKQASRTIKVTRPKGFSVVFSEIITQDDQYADQNSYQGIFLAPQNQSDTVNVNTQAELPVITIEIPYGVSIPINIMATESDLSVDGLQGDIQLLLIYSKALFSRLDNASIEAKYSHGSNISVVESSIKRLIAKGLQGAGQLDIQRTSLDFIFIETDGQIKISNKTKLKRVLLRSTHINSRDIYDNPEIASIIIADTSFDPDITARIQLGDGASVFFDTKYETARCYRVAKEIVQQNRLFRAGPNRTWRNLADIELDKAFSDVFDTYYQNYPHGRQHQSIEITPLDSGDRSVVLLG